jgi:hypothetical protein
MKEGCLFVLFIYHVKISQITMHFATLDIIGKPSMNRGATTWFQNVLTYGGRVIEY